MVDDKDMIVKADDVAGWMGCHPGGYRAAAKYFKTSASTLCRFMRRNGYRVVGTVLSPRKQMAKDYGRKK